MSCCVPHQATRAPSGRAGGNGRQEKHPGVEFFELYGHGPPAEGRSFMWTDAHAAWQEHNPPPLETIGDQTVQQWRAAEKAVEKAAT